MTIQRYVLSYDDEYDREIAEVIEETPKRRRAERIRQLIQLGLKYEAELRARNETPTAPVSTSSSQTELPKSTGKRPSIPPIQPKA